MKRFTLFSQVVLILCFSWFSFPTLTVFGQSPWFDGFESYTPGTWPATWIPDGNATNISSNYIDNTIAFQGTKSLRMYGVVGASWGALAYHPIDLNSPYEVEVLIRNGDEILTGAHPDRAGVGLRQGTKWWNPSRAFVMFKGDGTILGGGGSLILGNYSSFIWYKVRIRYEWISSSMIMLSYWINGDFKGFESRSAIPEENQLDNLELHVQEGTAWFDNVSVDFATNVHESLLKKRVDIFPVPASDRLFIKMQIKQNVNITFYNSLGQVVYTSKLGTENESINISELHEGIYFVEIIDMHGVLLLSEKIIKK